MYKSVEQYLGPNKKSLFMEPYSDTTKHFIQSIPYQSIQQQSIQQQSIQQQSIQQQSIQTNDVHKPLLNTLPQKNKLSVKWETQEYVNTMNPQVWGPPFWFSLHSSAAHYPLKASNMVRDLMVGRLLALPIEIPCASCRPHASAFIESNKHRLTDICSGRDSLFNFYVDFHNKVNERHNKPTFTYQQASEMWIDGVKVTKMKFIYPFFTRPLMKNKIEIKRPFYKK